MRNIRKDPHIAIDKRSFDFRNRNPMLQTFLPHPHPNQNPICSCTDRYICMYKSKAFDKQGDETCLARGGDYHHYSRLTESLNPAQKHPIRIAEWHLLGELDKVIPSQLFVSALKQQANSQLEVLPNIKHHQGWEVIWPHILKKLGQ
jgi:hypothetical protein